MAVQVSSAKRLYLAGGAAALLAAAGCSGDFPGAGFGGGADLPGADAAPDHTATLNVAASTAAGKVVTDVDGYTLYTYTADSARPSVSTCTEDCAEQWPPALVNGGITTEGIERGIVDAFERAEGGAQLTLAGWPLYRFSGDVDPGDVNGQGADGTWYAMTPGGKRAQALPYGNTEGTGGLEEAVEETVTLDGE